MFQSSASWMAFVEVRVNLCRHNLSLDYSFYLAYYLYFLSSQGEYMNICSLAESAQR